MAVNTDTWDGDAEYEVEKIIGHSQVDPATGFPAKFKIKWANWEDRFNSFEPLANLKCPDILTKYLKSHQISADEATRLRATTGQAPRKQVCAPPRRGRPPANASKSTYTKDHICAYLNGKTCHYKVLFCSTHVRNDADGNMVVHYGSRGLPSSSTSKSGTHDRSSKLTVDTRKKRAVTPKEDEEDNVQKRKRTQKDKAEAERDFYNKIQKQVSPRERDEAKFDTFTRPADSSDDEDDADNASVGLDIPEASMVEKPAQKVTVPVAATPKPVYVESTQSRRPTSSVHRRVVSRADRFKKPEAPTRLSDSSASSNKSSDKSSAGSSGRASRKLTTTKSPAKSSGASSRQGARVSLAKSSIKSPGRSPLQAKRRLFTSNVKTTPPQRDSRSVSEELVSTADRPRRIPKVPNSKKGARKVQNTSRDGSSSSRASSVASSTVPTPPRASTFTRHTSRPRSPSRSLSRSVSPLVSRSLSRSLSPQIRSPPKPAADTSKLKNGVSLSELAKLARMRSKSALPLPRFPSRAQGHENRREVARRPPSPVSRSKSAMVQKPVKRTVSPPKGNRRPTKNNHRPEPSNRLAQASAKPTQGTRRRRRS